jgi:autotransporter-associated beta strand protein
MNRTETVLGLVFSFIMLAGIAQAGNATWTGTSGNNWSAGGNWAGGAYPGSTSGTLNTDQASFTNTLGNRSPVFDLANINLGGFLFDTGAGAFTLGTTGGNDVLLSGGGSITVNSGVTVAQIVNAPIIIQNASGGSSGVYTNLNNSTTIGAALTLGGDIKGVATAGNTTTLTIGGLSVGANTVSGIISDGTAGGAVSLTKAGSGKWVLSGDNTYTGATVANGGVVFQPMPGAIAGVPQVIGTLQITGTLSNTSSVLIYNGGTLINGSSTPASNNGIANRINTAATLTMGGSSGGGTFTMAAPATGNTHSQTLAGLAVGAGGSVINASAATGTMNLNFNGAAGSVYSRSTGGMVTFATGTAVNVSFANAPTGAGVAGTSAPILIGATLGGTTWGGTDFVAANSGAVAAPAYDTALTADKNVNVIGDLSGGPLLINSLRLGDTTKRTVTLTDTNVIASGGILLPSTVTINNLTHTITGGYLTSGTGDLWIYSASGTQSATPRGTGMNGNPRGAIYALTLASPIVDNGATPVSLTIGGSGFSQVLIRGANTYSGGTYLANGMLVINADNNLGASSGAVTVTSGANNFLRLNNAITTSRNFVINSGTVLNVGGADLTMNGALTGGGNLQNGFYQGTTVLILDNDENGFTGTYTVGSFLRANDGVGLSSNANLHLASDNNPVSGTGTLETSANVTRSIGTGPGQVQFAEGQNGYGGGFSAVGGPVTVSLGGLGTPTALTHGSGAFYGGISTYTLPYGLVLQDVNANNTLTWANPINNNGNILYLNQAAPTSGTNTAATMTGVLSGTGVMVKEGLGLLIFAGPNTYTGQTRIQKGTLSVASIGSVNGAASNLGQPSSAANGLVIIGNAANTGTLLYTGSGETSDRTIMVGTNSATPAVGDTGGATIQNDGTGTLVFNAATFNIQNTGVIASSPRVLTLTGSNVGSNTIQGVIQDNTVGVSGTAAVAVVKSGVGTWVLSGANTYSWTTVVSNGTLAAGNSLAFSTNLVILAGGGLGAASGSWAITNVVNMLSNTTFDTTGTLALMGSITNNGTLTKAGSGAVLINGSKTGTNWIAVTVGTLGGTGTVAGVVTNLATITAGDTNYCGTLTLSSNLVMGAGSAFLGEYNASTSDVVSVSRQLTAGANCTVTLNPLTGVTTPPTRVTLFTYGTLVNPANLATWTVTGSDVSKYRCSVSSDATSVYVNIARRGTTITLY